MIKEKTMETKNAIRSPNQIKTMTQH